MADGPYFTPELFEFLLELRANNTREWFQANKQRYEEVLREPFIRFISDFGPRLQEISPGLVADPRPMGGSLFRIYRDTRFSKDKSPYKTAASAHFSRERRRDVHAPGFYLHLEPGGCFAGSGLWHPEPPTLARVRDAIVAEPERWKRAISGKQFAATHTLSGDRLRRPPNGYDPQHPLIEDLKWKDFVSSVPFDEGEVCAPDFMDRYAGCCETAAPFIKFLTTAVGLEW